MKNETILKSLKSKKTYFFQVLSNMGRTHELISYTYSELKKYDFDLYKDRLKDEINHNLTEWWINPEKGSPSDKQFQAVCFEYDNYFYSKGLHAESFGIIEWDQPEMNTDNFRLDKYEDCPDFYAFPGLTLDFFDELIDKFFIQDSHVGLGNIYREDIEGYTALFELYKYSGYIAIQQVFDELNNEGLFDSLNKRQDFMFLIEQHDSTFATPILIID